MKSVIYMRETAGTQIDSQPAMVTGCWKKELSLLEGLDLLNNHIRITVCGDSNFSTGTLFLNQFSADVGKSSFLIRYTRHDFYTYLMPTSTRMETIFLPLFSSFSIVVDDYYLEVEIAGRR